MLYLSHPSGGIVSTQPIFITLCFGFTPLNVSYNFFHLGILDSYPRINDACCASSRLRPRLEAPSSGASGSLPDSHEVLLSSTRYKTQSTRFEGFRRICCVARWEYGRKRTASLSFKTEFLITEVSDRNLKGTAGRGRTACDRCNESVASICCPLVNTRGERARSARPLLCHARLGQENTSTCGERATSQAASPIREAGRGDTRRVFKQRTGRCSRSSTSRVSWHTRCRN